MIGSNNLWDAQVLVKRKGKREEGGTLWKLGLKRRRRKRENLESCKTKENQLIGICILFSTSQKRKKQY